MFGGKQITLARRTLRRAGAAWKVEWLSEEQEGVLKSPRFEELLHGRSDAVDVDGPTERLPPARSPTNDR